MLLVRVVFAPGLVGVAAAAVEAMRAKAAFG